MVRLMLSDELWSKLRTIMRHNGVYDKPSLRLSVEGVLYRMRTGCPWRDLPKKFGNWNSIYKKFNYWASKDKLMKIFKSLIKGPDLSMEFIDGSFVKAHQHSTGATGTEEQDIGKSKGGNTTKIHATVDARGRPIEFCISAGNVNDCTKASEIIVNSITNHYVVADKGYDSEAIRENIENNHSEPVIPRRKNSEIGNENMKWSIYKFRHKVENLFARIKHYRAIATRYDKLSRNFKSTVALAFGFLWLSEA